MVQIYRQGQLRPYQDLEVSLFSPRRCNLHFNADDNGMMKAKKPGVIFEHIAKAVRSEGPVPPYLFSLEDLFSSSLSHLSMLTSGTQAKRPRKRLLQKLKRRDLRMRRTTKQLEIHFGLTDSTLPRDLIARSKTS